MRINLRQHQAVKLSSEQADESLQHLSRAQALSADTQLHTGGDYVVNANVSMRLGLPVDGNRFSITVLAGTVTLAGGTVGGVTDFVLPLGRHELLRVAGNWQLLTQSARAFGFRTVSSNTALNASQPFLWADTSSGAITATIPAGLDAGTTLGVVRDGAGSLTVATSGGEGVINPATGNAVTDGLVINREREVVWLHRVGSHWRLARSL